VDYAARLLPLQGYTITTQILAIAGVVTPIHKRAVDVTVKDADSCHCPDPFQPLPSDTLFPEVGCVQIQSCPPVLLSFCPFSVGVGLGFFFHGSSGEQVADAASLGFHPKGQARRKHHTCEHPGLVLSLISTCLSAET